MSDTLNLMRKLAGLTEMGEPVTEEPVHNLSQLIGRLHEYADDLQSISSGGGGSGRGVISGIRNILDIIEPTFPK